MRTGHRSTTSDYVAALRALYTQGPPALATADDPAAALLLSPTWRALLGLARLPGAGRLAHRLVGTLTGGLSYSIPLRLGFLDDAVRQSAREGTRQLVVLGAGLDARAYRLPELEGFTVFEVDHPDTQAIKRGRLELAPLAERVVYASIDFERQALDAVLRAAGHDASRPTVWVWEGVTMYLTEPAILATLDAVAATSAAGSRLLVTYLPPQHGVALLRPVGRAFARAVGEPLRSLITPEQWVRWLEPRGFELEADETCRAWARRYWPAAELPHVRDWERALSARRR